MGQWAKNTLAESESRKLLEESVLEEQRLSPHCQQVMNIRAVWGEMFCQPASQILFVTLNLPYAELHHPQIHDKLLETLFVGCLKYNSAQCIYADVQTFDLVT